MNSVFRMTLRRPHPLSPSQMELTADFNQKKTLQMKRTRRQRILSLWDRRKKRMTLTQQLQHLQWQRFNQRWPLIMIAWSQLTDKNSNISEWLYSHSPNPSPKQSTFWGLFWFLWVDLFFLLRCSTFENVSWCVGSTVACPPMQGVIEFSLALFFNKLVSYTFLFWLPFYVKNTCKFFCFKFFFSVCNMFRCPLPPPHLPHWFAIKLVQ